MARLTLREAIRRWQDEPRAPANAYEWYRRGAHRSGHVYLGPLTISAVKEGGTLYVDDADVDRAIEAHRQERAEVRRVTDDLEGGVFEVATATGSRRTGLLRAAGPIPLSLGRIRGDATAQRWVVVLQHMYAPSRVQVRARGAEPGGLPDLRDEPQFRLVFPDGPTRSITPAVSGLTN